MSELTVVLFRDGQDVGLVAGSIEVNEDTDDQLVLTATFDLSDDEVAGVLAEAVAQSKNVEGIGAAEGQVVGHSGD